MKTVKISSFLKERKIKLKPQAARPCLKNV